MKMQLYRWELQVTKCNPITGISDHGPEGRGGMPQSPKPLINPNEWYWKGRNEVKEMILCVIARWQGFCSEPPPPEEQRKGRTFHSLIFNPTSPKSLMGDSLTSA
jgi:hypothetical protein